MLFIVSATQGRSDGLRAEDTVKDFWATRPRRPRRGRKIAGVAAGIGNRYRLDPVLVRVGLVVASVYGGAGLLVYLLGWLFLPEQDDEVSPVESLIGKGRSSTSTGFTLLLCIALIPVLSWFFSGGFIGAFPGWLGLVVIGGLLFLLHQNRGGVKPVAPTATSTAPPADPMQPQPPPYVAPVTDAPAFPLTQPMSQPVTPPVAPPPPVAEERTTPPSWDPLGAAPFAWDLPEPAGPEPEQSEPPVRRRKSKVGAATLGIALVTVGVLVLIPGFSPWNDAQHVVGVVLAILGLGMVAGAFVRGGRGLIGLAVPLSVAGLALTMVSPDGWNGVGDVSARPTSIAEVQDDYVRSVGNVELDLTALPEDGPGVHTRANVDIGNVTVIVPANADVEVKCKVDRGNAECLGRTASGLDAEVPEFTDEGADGPGGLEIDLNVSSNTGNVEVRRG